MGSNRKQETREVPSSSLLLSWRGEGYVSEVKSEKSIPRISRVRCTSSDCRSTVSCSHPLKGAKV